jgi:hypothetical protein
MKCVVSLNCLGLTLSKKGDARTALIYIGHHLRVAADKIDELERRLAELGDGAQ